MPGYRLILYLIIVHQTSKNHMNETVIGPCLFLEILQQTRQ